MISLKQILSTGALILPCLVFADSKVNISGSEYKVIEVLPETSTGLNNIFVIYNTEGCILKFNASNGYTANVYRYSSLGGAYAEQMNDVERTSTSVSFPLTADDLGYIFEDGNSRYYYWIVNYANHIISIKGISPAEDQDCSYSVLNVDGDATAITYYTINGQPKTLSRDIHINYTTETFDSDLKVYVTEEKLNVYESVGSVVSISPPAYCSTYFTLSGDRFLKEWDKEIIVETLNPVLPFAVECHTEAIQDSLGEEDEASNVMGGDSSGLGGSAPANISFYAYTTSGVYHYEWQMSKSQDFEIPEYRFYQQDLDYTFNEEGTYYLRFIGSNNDGSCETIGDTYTVSIGASALECPNAFSPNDDGVNDVWKVSYRSLIEFHCEIFNRNGQRIYGFDDPADGWDGTWHGKKVKPGVYYYVITATGADGQKYKKSGDINIIGSKIYTTNSPSEEMTE